MRAVFAGVVGLIACLAQSGIAQELRGVVRDSASHQPIPGAVLVLLDSAGAVLGRNITNDRGSYRLAMTPDIRRIQVLHIGFRRRDVTVPVASSGIAQLDVTMAAIPTLLDPVSVTDRANCPRRADQAAAFALWEQARSALLATVVAREANPANVVRLRFDRRMNGNGSDIINQTILMDSVSTPRPFVAWRAASEFVERGFMTDSGKSRVFAAPDADVLLDEAFVAGYCFHIADPDSARPREIGLAFAPAKTKRGRVEIEGAVWIDSTTPSLTRIAYRYVGVVGDAARFKPHGRIEFRSMANGTVLIDRWFIRLGVVDTFGLTNGRILQGSLVQPHDIGGEVAAARWPDSLAWHGTLGAVRGRLSSGNGNGTIVRLLGTPYQTIADSSGLFEIPNLLPGPYTIGVVDPRLAVLGIVLKTGLEFTAVRDSTISLFVEVPSAERYMSETCEADAETASPAVLTARVNLPNGSPASRAKVRIRLANDANVEPVDGLTDRNGLFHLCHAPLGQLLEIRVVRDGLQPVVALRRIDNALVTMVLQMSNSASPR